MSNHHTETYETEGVVNVTFVIDGDGKGWYCDGKLEDEAELSSACESEEAQVYDRGFGG